MGSPALERFLLVRARVCASAFFPLGVTEVADTRYFTVSGTPQRPCLGYKEEHVSSHPLKPLPSTSIPSLSSFSSKPAFLFRICLTTFSVLHLSTDHLLHDARTSLFQHSIQPDSRPRRWRSGTSCISRNVVWAIPIRRQASQENLASPMARPGGHLHR